MSKSYNYKGFRIEILYEDNDIAILNKPSGLLTHKKNENDTSPSLQESLKDQFMIKIIIIVNHCSGTIFYGLVNK